MLYSLGSLQISHHDLANQSIVKKVIDKMNTRNENIVINVFSKVNMQSGGHNDLKLCYFSLDGNILLYKFQVLQNFKLSDINASNSFISVYIMVNLI